MKLGAYTACLHDRPLAEALDVLRSNGLTSVEVNTGGFIPSPHCHVDLLLSSAQARRDYLDVFASRDMELTGLNCNGNPLNPLPGVGPRHADDLRRTIELAGLLGVRNVVTMSGTPGSDPDAKYPSWVVNPWDGVYMDVLDYQWGVAAGFWEQVDALAQANDVRVAIEMHPHNLVFSPVTLKKLVDLTGARNVGAEMDPSHLMWQGMDVAASIRWLGPLVFHAAAKDAMITPGVGIRGVLDTSFERVPADAPDKVPTGYGFWCNAWPADPAWRFVAVGIGHDIPYWAEFLTALAEVDPDMAVNIEHEDTSYSRLDGLALAAENLKAAAKAAGISSVRRPGTLSHSVHWSRAAVTTPGEVSSARTNGPTGTPVQRRWRGQGGGRMVNVTSANDIAPAPFGGWYSPSKSALMNPSYVSSVSGCSPSGIAPKPQLWQLS